MIYSSSLNKDHQHNLDRYIFGGLLSDASCILWNFMVDSLLTQTT